MAKTTINVTKRHKYERILDMVFALESGKRISKSQLANEYKVDERTIQRDIADIRAYYSDSYSGKGVVYDRVGDRYMLCEDLCA